MRRMYYEFVGVVQGREMTPYRTRLVMGVGFVVHATILLAATLIVNC